MSGKIDEKVIVVINWNCGEVCLLLLRIEVVLIFRKSLFNHRHWLKYSLLSSKFRHELNVNEHDQVQVDGKVLNK